MARVLAVEDSPTQAGLLRADLEGAGFTVTVASSGDEALQLLMADRFDILISDIMMPGMDGYQLCRRIKDDPDTERLPVVLLTSLTHPLEVVKALEAGADNFLRKPYQLDQLVARVQTLLQNTSVRQGDHGENGVRLSFLDREFHITAERQQILDLLISTFEDLVVTSRTVRAREQELSRAHAVLEQQLDRVNLEHNRLQAVVDAVPVPLFVTGRDGRISHSSQSLAEMLGATPEQIQGTGIDQLVGFVDVDGQPIAPDTLPHQRAVTEGKPRSMGWAFDVCLARRDGTRPPVMFHASPVLDEQGGVAGCVGTLQILGPLARHDSFTGLPNLVAFLDRAASIPPAGRASSAVVLIELDRLDALRASLGNAASSAVVAGVSRRLRRTFRSTVETEPQAEHFLAYLGGDQFGVILVNLLDTMGALRLAETARRVVAEGHPAEQELRLTASVGVSVGAADLEIPHLLAAARSALHRAQEGGGNTVELLGPVASQEQMDRLHLEMDLRGAVDRNELELEYQPEIDLATGRLLGFEALARWRHERRGLVPPGLFIGVAEESGLILELGRQVLSRACAEACQWRPPPGEPPLTVSVNVSAVQLRARLVDEVMGVLEQTGLDPARLMIEVTETAAMGDPDTTVPVLAELRRRGVRVSLDDFGTGYSSLSQLTRINFDQLKLDRSFVSGMSQGGADAIVAQSIVALGHSLGVPVLAEGVEEHEQAKELRALGCEQAQGYLFSRPLPRLAVQDFIARSNQEHPGESERI